MMHRILAVVLAGGKGSRLEPLTRDRAKPAVPFGGGYRIIDFSLSNCLNSGIRKLLVLTQYKAMSLDRHINLGWRGLLCRELGELSTWFRLSSGSTNTGIREPPTRFTRIFM
jgi:glucose-1-phosphate adenylyltransferase